MKSKSKRRAENAPIRVVIYCRVSTDKQAERGLSLEAQEAKGRAYAELHELDVVAVITDPGFTAKNLDRPGLQRALAMLDTDQADGIVITKLDRLARSVFAWGELVETYFRDAGGFRLFSVSDHIDTSTAAGRMVLNVLMAANSWEREAAAERTTEVLAHLKAQGRVLGAVPLGLTRKAGELRECSIEAKAVRRMGVLRDLGLTMREIADKLQSEGYPTKRGRSWHATTVQRVLARQQRSSTARR